MNFIESEGKLVPQNFFEIKFSCDLKECKGACCTMESDFGAPLLKEEISRIEDIIPAVKEYLPPENIEKIEKEGFYENIEGELMIKSLDRKNCLFSYFEGDVAKCGIERAYFDKKINFRKPISCHLFPIRVNDFGGPILRYEKYEECSSALEKGEETDENIIEFCSEALIRAYGKEWYNNLISIYKE